VPCLTRFRLPHDRHTWVRVGVIMRQILFPIPYFATTTQHLFEHLFRF
jgi:hypothetical protein